MKDFELKTLIFNDGDKFRSFQSEDFNFILDKKSGMSICYGETPAQTPTYDPLSPEIIDIIIDKNFIFDDEIKNINKLFNIDKDEKHNGDLITISTISTMNFIIDDIYIENAAEIVKFYEYINKFNIFVNLVVPYENIKELRDALRLKFFNIQNIVIKTEDFNFKDLLNQINLLLSKNLNVSYDFYISKNNYEEFISLINGGFPGNTFSNIIFKDNSTKSIRNKIVKAINDKGNFSICDTKKIKNESLNYSSIILYQDSLFKCYIDFNNKKVSYSQNFEEFIPFRKIKRIDSYWHSDEFKKYRNSLIKDKYEDKLDVIEKNEENNAEEEN